MLSGVDPVVVIATLEMRAPVRGLIWIRSLVVKGPGGGGWPPPVCVDPQRLPLKSNVKPLIGVPPAGTPIAVTAPFAGLIVTSAPLLVEPPPCPPSEAKIIGPATAATEKNAMHTTVVIRNREIRFT